MKKQNLMMAAIAIAMQMPICANEVIAISQEYGVDHREVMSQVAEILSAEGAALEDMSNSPA